MSSISWCDSNNNLVKKKPSVNSGKGLKRPAFLSFSEQQMRKIMDGRIAKGITLFLYHGVVVAFVY